MPHPASATAGDAVRIVHPIHDRSTLRGRILHLGFGAFARAFLSTILDETLDAMTADGEADWGPDWGPDWGMIAVRLNSGVEELDALEAAELHHWVVAADDSGMTARRVEALAGTCHPLRDGAEALFARFASPELAIVTLTITEKGYCSRGGRLDTEHEGVRRDLAAPKTPQTAVGVLVEGLARRRQAGLGGLTLLSCDNLPENGAVCRAVVEDFAARRDPALAEWIAANVTFPCTMVDRIVPALDEDGRALLAELGLGDAPGIVCEPFRQWVIEDDFAAGRPPFELAGAEFVADVRPFEEMKLRMLNGSHSFLAYLGALSGRRTISDCMADPLLAGAARGLMLAEQAPTLSMPQGVDLAAYAEALLARFANSRLKHRTTQIATDGSQKLPQRLLAPIRHHLEAGTPWPRLALGIAGWLAYCRGVAQDGTPLPLNDPLAERIRTISQAAGDERAYLREMLSLREVFAAELAGRADFAGAIEAAYLELREHGVEAALARLAETPRESER